MDLDSFHVDEVIVHDVPLPEDAADLLLTDAPVALDTQLRDYFRQKVVDSLSARGLDVAADATGDPTIRDAALQLVVDPNSLVDASHRIANRLYSIQSGRNSPGLLAIIRGQMDRARCVAILKLEREQGVHVEIRDVGGKRVIDLEFLRDLTLTDKTRVFKTALMRFNDSQRAESMAGVASDDQRSRTEGTGVAEFFLSTFLGCEVAASPERSTLAFAEAARHFIDEDVVSPRKQSRYHVALLATLEDETLDLRPRRFAQASIDQSDRSKFLRRVEEAGLDPGRSFEKNVDLVRLKGFRLVFEKGMTLIGSREDLEERVEMPPSNQSSAGVRIRDQIKRFQGR